MSDLSSSSYFLVLQIRFPFYTISPEAKLLAERRSILNILTKANLLAWYASQKIKHGVKKVFNLSLTDPKAWDRSLWNLRGAQSLSGETVTEETALTYSAFWNAITLLAGPLGSMPLHLIQKKGKTKENAIDQSLYHVLHTQYNPYMTAMAGRECLASHVLTWGNGYAEIIRNGYGDVSELWPIPPNRVIPTMEGGDLVYKIRVANEEITLQREKILHIPGLGFDGFIGYSIVAMARKSIGLGMAMETFGSKYFGDGTHPSGIITHLNQLKDPKAMRQAINEVYSGLGNAHRLMLLEEGMDFKSVGIQPEDSQFLQSRQFQITDMARWANLPVHKLKEMTKSSFNNIESENASYVVDSLLPWFIRFEQNYNMQLLSKTQKKQGLYFKHNFEGLLRANSKDRALYYKLMIGSGIMTPNEVREKEDFNPSEDPLADELFMPTGLIPLSKFEDYLAKNTEKQTEPKQIPEETENEEAKSRLRLLQNRN